MNFKRGVSLLIVTISIIILIIITGTIIINGSDIREETKLKRFGTELLQIEQAVNQYVRRKSGNIDWNKKTIKIDSLSTQELSQYSQENITEDLELYIVNLYDIGAETSKYGTEYNNIESDDIYLWSKSTNNIYYQKGYETKENIYYTLTPEIMEKIK